MKAGPGSNYIQAFKDKDGNRLDGGKSYRLRVPPNVPAAAFWSVTLYDTGDPLDDPEPEQRLRALVLRQAQGERGRLDRPLLRPKAPAGQESNWIQTVAGKGFYPMMRFYSPKAGLFDGTWKLPDVELVR